MRARPLAGAGRLDALRRALPGPVAEELADGVIETFHRHLATDRDPGHAAEGTIAEFGDVRRIVAAFVEQSAGRRAARRLLGTGPAVGACWAAALIVDRAWTWPTPAPVRAGLGLTLATVIALLALAATATASYRRTRLAALAAVGLIGLDTGLTIAAAVLLPALTPPLAVRATTLACTASLTRLSLTARALPGLLSL